MFLTLNLKAVRNTRVRPATSTTTRGSRSTCRQEQAPEGASSQLTSQQSQTPTPSGAPPSGIEVNYTGVSQTVAPPTPSQDGASQNMETAVQGLSLVKSSLTQFGVIPQEAPDQSQAQSDTR